MSGDTFTATERYLWEGNTYYSPLVCQVYNNARYYPMYDGLGSTRQLLDADEAVTDTYTYEGFGNLMGSSGSTPNLAKRRLHRGRRRRHGGAAWPHLATYRYVGSLGYYQTGSSFMHLGARYYMPEVGRFARPGSPYVYGDNDPANSTQADGKNPRWPPGWKPSPPGQPFPHPGWKGREYDINNIVQKPHGNPTVRGKCAESTYDLYDKCMANKWNRCAAIAGAAPVKVEMGEWKMEVPGDVACFMLCMNAPEMGDCWRLWGEAILKCMASARGTH